MDNLLTAILLESMFAQWNGEHYGTNHDWSYGRRYMRDFLQAMFRA